MNTKAYFGKFGGQFVPETVMFALDELEAAYERIVKTAEFEAELDDLLKNYVGRPSPLYHAKRLSEHYGHEIYLKREDLNHTGAHKINNALAQALLAKKMGKKKIIAETGAGQHGVATATAAALFGLECDVYMGETDAARQQLNAFRMQLLGANLIKISTGLKTLKEATTAAIQAWVNEIESVFYVIGSAVGPHPYPSMVRDFQKMIGEEIRAQVQAACGQLPDALVACVGGGSNAIGTFYDFKDEASVKKYGVEAGGRGEAPVDNARTLSGAGEPGVLHGAYSYLLQDADGQVVEAYSISAGLDYPGVGPEHSYFKDQGIVEYVSVTDEEALAAFQRLCRLEGIVPAMESSHALAYLEKLMPGTKENEVVVVCLSGRGDKDVQMVAKALGRESE
mgnify:CR=1 FL=1